ncbi:MAG TPA: hypothetical protein VIX86_09015 [Streptosporangiaceae bacterium]
MVTGAAPAGGQPAAPPAGSPAATAAPRKLPPVTGLAVTAMALVIAGGIDLAAHLPRPAPLGPPAAALAAAVVAMLAAAAVLAGVRDFAWRTFFVVAGWTLAAYVVIAGMLEFVFVLDHTPGRLLTVLTLMLVVFAIDVPLLLAFSVARYQPGRAAEPAGMGGAGLDAVPPDP